LAVENFGDSSHVVQAMDVAVVVSRKLG